MNWDAIGAVGELIGAVGVIISLVYLAVQIRQNTKSLRASAYDSITSHTAELNKLIISDPEISSILDEGDQDRSSLTRDRRKRYDAFQRIRFRHYDNLHHQYRHGLLDESRWQPLQNALVHQIQKPGVVSSWSHYSKTLNKDFVEFVEGLIEEHRGTA